MQFGMEVALAALDAKARFRAHVPRNAVIDLVDGVKAIRNSAARHALQLGLEGRSATELTGYETHKVMERKIRQISTTHRGVFLDGSLFPGTELQNFQALAVFGSILIARASIFEVRALPSACTTRRNGSSLNWPFSHQEELLFRDPGDDPTMFALLLTCRDKEVRGKYHEVAIGAIEPDYSGFIFYEAADSFIAGYGAASGTGTDGADAESGPHSEPALNMKLRDVKKPFDGGENPNGPDEEEGSGGVP